MLQAGAYRSICLCASTSNSPLTRKRRRFTAWGKTHPFQPAKLQSWVVLFHSENDNRIHIEKNPRSTQKTTFSEIPHLEQLLATLRSSKHDIAAHLRRCSEYIGAMMKSSTNPKGSESNFNWQGEAPQWCLSTHDYYSWLVVDLPLWNILIWKSVGIMTSQYMEKCSKMFQTTNLLL